MNNCTVWLAMSIGCFSVGDVLATPHAMPNTVRAEYHPKTGNIKVSANQVLNWYVEHLGHDSMTGDAPLGLPVGTGLIVDSDTRIGEVGFSLFSADVDLGQVAATSLPNDGSLVVCWNYALSPPTECYPVAFVPEPTTLFMVFVFCVLASVRKQRTSIEV